MKPHLIETADVLVEGSDLVAMCGAKIQKSRFIRLLESDFIPGAFRITGRHRLVDYENFISDQNANARWTRERAISLALLKVDEALAVITRI